MQISVIDNLIWSMPIDYVIRNADFFPWRSDWRTCEIINEESTYRSVYVSPGKASLDSWRRRKCICELSSYRDFRIDRFTVLMANTCLVCISHRIPSSPLSLSLPFHRHFSPSFHFFFHSRSLFHPFTMILPCPVTMIDRFCQDRAASTAHARFLG